MECIEGRRFKPVDKSPIFVCAHLHRYHTTAIFLSRDIEQSISDAQTTVVLR